MTLQLSAWTLKILPGLLFFSAQAVDVDVVLVGGQVGHTEGGAQVGHVEHVGHVGGGGQVQSSHSSQQLSHGAGAGQGVDSHVTTSVVGGCVTAVELSLHLQQRSASATTNFLVKAPIPAELPTLIWA